MKELTEKQRKVLDFIENFQEEQGMAPTVAEISEYFGIKSSTAFAHLKALERKKELSRSSKARSINLANATGTSIRLFSGALIIPLLGRVNAGMPTDNSEYKECDVTVDKSLLNAKNTDNLFALRINGESMREAGILDGDIIIVEKNLPVRAGDIVVALVHNEVTVKSYYPQTNGIIELHPANKDFSIQRYNADEVAIQGKVIFLQRQI